MSGRPIRRQRGNRCPECGHNRKHDEPQGNHGGEVHARRGGFVRVDGKRICEWCYGRRTGEPIVGYDSGNYVVRCPWSGRVVHNGPPTPEQEAEILRLKKEGLWMGIAFKSLVRQPEVSGEPQRRDWA